MFCSFVHQSREIDMRRYLAIAGAVLGGLRSSMVHPWAPYSANPERVLDGK